MIQIILPSHWCRRNLNSSCNAVAPVDILPDGTPCFQGFCNKGMCEKTSQDIVRIWDFIDEISMSSFLKFLKDNVVGTVIVISLIFWVPISCLISWIDRKRAEEDAADWEWKRTDELIHPNDKRRIIHMRVPKKHSLDPATPEHLGHRPVPHNH